MKLNLLWQDFSLLNDNPLPGLPPKVGKELNQAFLSPPTSLGI